MTKKIARNTYWLIPLLAAVILLAFRLVTFGEVWNGLTSSSSINPIKILVLFLSMTVLSIFLDETGFFKWLANMVTKKAGTSQLKLFTALFITISVVTIFTSNDIVILTFTPFVCYFAKNANINPIPYLVSQFVAANTASMLFIIGNPTNIYIATSSGITFTEYLAVMALPTLFATVTAYVVMLLLFYKQLKKPITGQGEQVIIKQKPLLVIGITLLSATTVLLVVSSYINTAMWLIAAVAAATLTATVLLYSLIKKKAPKELGTTLKRTPWALIPFIISMFIMVIALEKFGVTAHLASFMGDKNPILTYGIMSTLFSNLINNIPTSVLFSSILQNSAAGLPGTYATIIGSNIGAFLTPLGALAGIMWLAILKRNGIKFRFWDFLKYGTVIAVPVLFAALLGLWIVI